MKAESTWVSDPGSHQRYSSPESPALLVRRNLKVLLKARGYPTIERFAHEVGIAKSTLSQIINRRRSPRLDTLEMLAKGLEVPLVALLLPPDPIPQDWDDL